MLLYRSWELRTSRIAVKEETEKFTPELSFKYIEKIFLYIAKHTIQSIVLFSVKTWFLLTTKLKIWIQNKLPKIDKFFKKKESDGTDSRKISFVERAILESKIKIKRVKEKIKNEHAEEIKEVEEVDKIL